MRNHSVDFFRGIAILIMVAANSYPLILPNLPCPMIIRVLFSTAAPIFIFLSGVSLRLSEENGKSILNTIKRISQLVFFAVIIDVVIWGILPFYTMDVLYLISCSLMTILVFRKLPDFYALVGFIFCLSLTIIFSSHYNFHMNEMPVFESNLDYHFEDAAKSFFVDGWFPVFPWLTISIIGYYLAKHRIVLSKNLNLVLASGIAGVFCFVYFTLDTTFSFNPPRSNYLEIFYPVTLPFFVYMLSIFLLVFYFMVKNNLNRNYIGILGCYSLAVYFFHAVLLQFYIPIFDFENSQYTFLDYLQVISSVFITIFCYIFILFFITKKMGKRFPIIKFLLGI